MTPWEEYKKRQEEENGGSSENGGNGDDSATSPWEEYKKRNNITTSPNAAGTKSNTASQPELALSVTPMMRAAAPEVPGIPKLPMGPTNVIGGTALISAYQKQQAEDPKAQAVFQEKNSKESTMNWQDSQGRVLSPEERNGELRKPGNPYGPPLNGYADTILNSSKSSSALSQINKDMELFRTGTAMSQQQMYEYEARLAGIEYDADYSLNWLNQNRSRISEQEYTSLKEYYTAQKQSAEYLIGVIDWYKNGGSPELLAQREQVYTNFQNGSAPIEEVSMIMDLSADMIETIDSEIKALDLQIETLTNDHKNNVENTMSGTGESGVSTEDTIEYENQLAQLNAQRETAQGRRDAAQQRYDLAAEEYRYYFGLGFSAAETDPEYEDIVAKGKQRWETAYNQYVSAYSSDPMYHMAIDKYNEAEVLKASDPSNPAIATMIQDANIMLSSVKEKYIAAYPIAIQIGDEGYSESQRDVFYYFAGKGYDSMAVQFAQQCANEERQAQLKEIEEWAGTNAGTMILASLGQLALLPFSGLDMAMASAHAATTDFDSQIPIGFGGIRSSLNSGVAQELNLSGGTINSSIPVVGGKGWGDVYQLGMSSLESFIWGAATGEAASGFLAMGAGSAAYQTALTSGASVEQAFLQGMAQMASEAIFEKISLGQLFNGKKVGNIFLDALIQAGFEGTEEVATDVTNYFTDQLIMQEYSQREQAIRQYQAEGMSLLEAERKANQDFALDVAYSGLAGLVSGFVMEFPAEISGAQRAEHIKTNVDKIMANPESVAYKIATEAAGVQLGATQVETRKAITKWLESGGKIDGEDIRRIAEDYNAKTQAQQMYDATAARAEQVQAANPDANVITSNGTQVYLNLGFDLKTAQQAGATLDGIVVGEITSQNMTNTQATSLHLETQIGVEAVKQVLGIQVERTQKGSPARALARNVVQQYEQNKAVATPVSQAQQTAQTMPGTAEGQNVASAQAQEIPQTAQPVQQPAETQLPRPIPRAEQAVRNTDDLRLEDLIGATSSVPTMSTEAVASVEAAAEQQQRAKAPDWDTFRRNYVAQNKGASYNDAVAAYQDVLQGNQSGETRQSTKNGTVGLERNEYSEQLDKSVTDGVDSLGKLFGLRIRFADLGTDNGYYTIGTNDVVLDIAPSRAGIGRENAFRFVIAHEIGHAAKDRLGAERWQQFEDYAVKIMGGEKAITAKQKEGAAYADEAAAREDVACDFIGQLLSDKATLDNFCEAIRSGEVQKETARGFMAAVRKILGKLRGKGVKQFDAVTKQLAEKAAKQFGTELETAENAVKAMQQVLSEAANAKQTVEQDGGTRQSLKDSAYLSVVKAGDLETAQSDIRHSKKEGATVTTATAEEIRELEARAKSAGDRAYIEALRSGNEARLEEIIAAEGRKHGFTEDAYHGTDEFGHMSFDTKYSDDNIALFFSDSEYIASTYGELSKISRKPTTEAKFIPEDHPNANYPELFRQAMDDGAAGMPIGYDVYKELGEAYGNIADLAQNHPAASAEDRKIGRQIAGALNEWNLLQEGDEFTAEKQQEMFAFIGDKQLLSLIGKLVDNIAARVGDVSSYRDLKSLGDLGEYAIALEDANLGASAIIESISAASAFNYSLIDIRNESVLSQDEYFSSELYSEDEKRQIARRAQRAYKTLKSGGGVYKLLLRPGKSLTYDSKGGDWNAIPGEIIGREGTVKTRDVSAWAKQHGYDSVHIENLNDPGPAVRQGRRESGIYILFDGANVKSADGITRDAEGKILLPSERFSARNDIRFSKKSKSDSSDEYDTSGMHWAIKDHLIDRKDLAVFYDAIAKLSKLGYYYPRTFDGEYIVENGNVMMFTDGNYEQPTISRVISFNDKSETNMAEYKEWIYNGVRQRGTTGLREAIDLIEAIEGDGYVSQRSPSDRGPYGWKNRAGEGSDRRAAFDGADTAGKTVRESKKSTDSNTAYSERYGSEMQTEGQVARAQARAEQRAAEVKQMNEAAAVVEETKAMVSEALETAEKPKTSERVNPLLKPKDTGRADFVEMSKAQLDKEVSKISEEQKEAKEQSKAAPLLKNGKPAANVKPKVNAESVQTAVVDIVQQHGAKTDTASVAEKASELTDAFREAAEIAEDINAESAATYLWDKVDSVAEQVFTEGTLHNSETGKTERYDHTYNHQERKSIVDSIKAKMIEAFAQATSSNKTQKQIDRIVQRMNNQVEKALKAAEAKRVRDLAKQAERAEYKAAQQKSQSKESAAKKIDAIRNRYDAKISDLEQKLKDLAKEQRKGSKALETEKRKGAAALSKAERRAEQKAERDRKRIEADYQRQLDRLRKAKDAEIKALTQEVALQVYRRGQAGREAEAALRAWRRDAGIDERIISEEDIKTAIKTTEDLAREAEAKNRKPLGAKAASLVKGAYKAFVSDTFELEQFSRRQSREDNLGTMITAYRNRTGIVDAILDRHLVDPDGNVIDNRSLADVLLVTKNGKPDADAQALLGEYSYHKHGVDRMSIEKRAAENMQRFLKQHPEYDSRHGLVATGTLDRATSITEKDGRVRKKSPAQLRPLSYKEILTRAMNGDTVAQEYIALAKAFSEAKDKPLMGTKDGRSINAATHQAIVDNMEASNPWLVQKHDEIMAWWDKFMRAWSVGPFGTLTQYEALIKLYPNYVPTFRVLEKKSGGLRSKNSIDVDSPFQKATGSHLDLRSMEENFAAQVANVVRQARQNDMWLNVRMETIVGDSDISDYARYPGFHNGSAIDYYSFFEDETAPEDQDLKAGNFVEEKGYVKWYGYSNGVREYIEISKDMYDGLLSLMNATKADSVEFLRTATKVGRALSAPLRATATDYSPVFPITNLIKDFQSAIIYGGFGMVPHEFAAAARMLGYEFGDILNIAKKIALKKSSDAENTKFVRFVDAVNAKLQENSRWQTFLDLGGKYSTRSSNEFNLAERRGSFRHSAEYKLGSKPKRAAMIAKQGAGKVASALGALGEFTESVTRFAAFNRYLDKHGDSAESRKAAMKEAAEITVDFSRHGSVGKYLNAFTPYLNASIQSIDKFFREVATRKGAERWHLLKRGAIMGTVPTLILMLSVIGLMDDDEEEVYRNLNQRTRDAYYSIPLEDGTAITIPKERQYAQLLGNVIERVVLWATDGDENSQLKDYFSEYLDTSIETNFVPNIPIWDSPIIGTLIDIGRNEDFAGRAIVPAKFKGAAPEDQYDETTSAFAIWMGKTFGVSPMVVDYWITDNFASYGDTFVAMTNEAENDGNIWDLFLGSYIQAFSADTAYSSRISEQYYNMRNGLSEKKEGERLHLPEDEYENSFTLEVYRAIEKFNDDITEINDLIKETEDEDEKRALKFAAQKIMEEALDFYERCMNGEIEDPVLYLAYEPYGDAIRDELTRLDEYNGEDYDYTFVPNPQAPKIGDHKNTDEEKAAYVDIYNRHYTEQVGSVMASLEYQNADDEQKLNYLEEARELAYYYSKQEFAQEFGIESETYDPDDATHVYDDLMDAGFTFFEAYEVEQKYKEIRDNKAYQNANVRVTEYNRWIDNHRDWTAVQKKAVRDAYNFTQTKVAEPEKYDALTDTYNLSPDKAASVVSALSGKGYTDSQRNSKIVSMSGLTNKERYSVLMSYYDSENDASRRKKIEAAQNAGISAQTYVRVWQDMSALESDKDKNGETIRLSLKNKRAEYLRNATGLTDAQKNLIWQEYYNSENERPDGWRYRYS